MKFKNILGDLVLIKVDPMPKQIGNILLPNTYKRGMEEPRWGYVVQLGSGIILNNGKIVPFSVDIGDRVLYNHFSGTDLEIDKEEFKLISESHIIAIAT